MLLIAIALQSAPSDASRHIAHPVQTPSELGIKAANTLTNPLFEVVGTKIYDHNGREFIAKGVNVNGPGFGWPGDTPGYAEEIIERWQFNSIRLNVKELEPAPWTYTENGTIDEIIEAGVESGSG